MDACAETSIDMRWACAANCRKALGRGGHFEYRHAHTRAAAHAVGNADAGSPVASWHEERAAAEQPFELGHDFSVLDHNEVLDAACVWACVWTWLYIGIADGMSDARVWTCRYSK